VPVAWRVRATQGNIGFAVQKELLNTVLTWLPDSVKIMLAELVLKNRTWC
jgi:hypothetical protein